MEGLTPEGIRAINSELYRKINALAPVGQDITTAFEKEDELVMIGKVDRVGQARADEFYPDLETLNPPFVGLKSLRNDAIFPVTTPYGVLPDMSVGSDGEIYVFRNWYEFDGLGNGVKVEAIEFQHALEIYGSVEEAIRDMMGEEYINEVGHLNFVPDEKDSRATAITIDDYEVILGILREIEEGEWERIR